MATHTPGPWSRNNSPLDMRRDSQRIDGADGKPIASTHQLQQFRSDKTAAFYEAHANAQLIAAAPELLAALRSIAECCDEAHGVRDYCSRQTEIRGIARHAITKATGESA